MAVPQEITPILGTRLGELVFTPTDLLYFAQGSRTLLPNSWTSSLVEVIDEDNTMLLARSKKPVAEEPVMHLRVLVLVIP